MATLTGNYVCDNSTLANFKSWAMAISSAFATFGWVQTADSGQVNWSAIASVPSSSFVYEIWKCVDSLAATLPIFIKFEYGYSSTNVCWRITAGTGSDGAGNINGTVLSSAPWGSFAWNGNSNQGATTFPCFFSGDAGSFRFLMWTVNSSTQVLQGVNIERSKNISTGVDTASYFTVLQLSYSSSVGHTFQQTIFAGGAAPLSNVAFSFCPTVATGFNVGTSTTAAWPIFTDIGKLGPPLLNLMVCCQADVGWNTTVTVASIYGSSHTYLATFSSTNWNLCLGARNSNSTNLAVLMRYE